MNDKEKEIDRANSYKQMFELWAWKDFQSFLEKIKVETVNDFIAFNEQRAVEFRAGEFKGVLTCLEKIRNELNYIVESK